MTPDAASVPERGRLTRLELLSKVGELAGILEYDAVLSAVARLSIPELADWCIVDVVDDGKARRAQVAYRDPAKAAIAEHVARLPPSARRRDPTWEALVARRSLLVPQYAEGVGLEHAWSPAYVALARELRVRSVLAVPLVVRGAVVAVSTFVTTSESGRCYGPEEVALAEELARRAAAVVENARLHEELERSEQRFRIALADTHVSVFEKDRHLRFRWVYNPMLGLDPAEMIGKGDEAVLGPDAAPYVEAKQREVLETGEPIREEIRVRPAGEVRHLLAHVAPLRGPSGDIVGLTGAVADVTEQKRVQEALADALAFHERMLGILGHDLRNPLSAVVVGSSLLLRRADLPEDAREQVARMDRASKRMLEMIETLLDFSRSRFKGALPITPVAVDLHEVARAVTEELRAANPGRDVELETRGDGRGCCDPARMAQVLSNLVGNALVHGARDGPVRVSVAGDGDALSLAVSNHGTPIPEDLLPMLFEPFRQGPGRRDAPRARGLGLGLYIAKQIVTAHGGEIDVRSSAESGTTFTVRVPRWPASESPRDPHHGVEDGANA